MHTTTITSREFNQHASEAKKAAKKGPVFITDRGRPAHVLLSIEGYRAIAGGQASIVQLLAMPGGIGPDFDPPRLASRGKARLYRPEDLP